jgi:glycosyltransferase involved in cell wall biosynthesis
MKPIFLSVVIPCYDEMANLQKGVLDKVKSFLDKKKYSYEVIVVDDGSTDGSAAFLKEFMKDTPHFRLVKSAHSGKAGAVTKGVLEAKGEYILFTDMDQATPIEEVDKLLPFFEKGFAIVIGSRNQERKGSPWTRLIMSRTWMILRNSVIGLNITDTQCGFKMFRHDAAQKIFGVVNKLHNGFGTVKGSSVTAGFDVEVLYLAMQMKYTVREVPVRWLYVETRRVNLIHDSIEGIADLARIKKNALTGRYRTI